MDLQELKKQFVCGELEITSEHGRIFSFVDFSNVNKWFENDDQDWNNLLVFLASGPEYITGRILKVQDLLALLMY